MQENFSGWRRLAASGPGDVDRPVDELDRWVAANLDTLAEVESGWTTAAEGQSLVHLDLRSDNLMIDRAGRVWFIDWAHGAVGAPWLDLARMAPSVAMEGGPDPEELWRRSPFGSVDDDELTSVVAAVAGYFTYAAKQPTPIGLPTLRAFQEAQGVHARRWLRQRL